MLKSAALLVLSAVCELVSGYLIWQWLRQGRSAVLGFLGGGILILLSLILRSFQPSDFGRAFAAYGGVFIALSLCWARFVDHQNLGIADFLGGILCLAGAGLILYWPR